MSLIRLAVVLLYVAVPVVVQGQPAPTLRVSPPQLKEWVQSSVETSGEDLVGLTSSNYANNRRSNTLRVFGLKASDKTLCVHLEHASGLYFADFSIQLNGKNKQLNLDIQSSYLREYARQVGEIAVRAQVSVGLRCSEDSTYLAVGWDNVQPSTVLLINSQGSSIVSGFIDNGQPISCRSLKRVLARNDIAMRSFDTMCLVRKSNLCESDQNLSIVRRTGRDFRPIVNKRIRSFC